MEEAPEPAVTDAGDGDPHSEDPDTLGSDREEGNAQMRWTAEEWDEWASWYQPWWEWSWTSSSGTPSRNTNGSGHGLRHQVLPGGAASSARAQGDGPRLPQHDLPGGIATSRSWHSPLRSADHEVSWQASNVTHDSWGGWGSSSDPWADSGGGVPDDEHLQDQAEHQSWSLRGSQQGAGGNDKISVPEFSGEDDKDGLKARGYLRKIEAWRRVTRLAPEKQALVLYNGLTGRAWRDAENLDLATLEHLKGVDIFKAWITDKYLDKEIIKVGKYMHEFFKSLRRAPSQDIREFNMEFERQAAKLKEVGCSLPDVCLAWWYVDKLRLDNSGELNLLSSTGNRYELMRLQDAAIIQDRGSRRLWENKKGDRDRRGQQAYIAEAEIPEDSDYPHEDEFEEPVDYDLEEDDAEAHEAYVAFQNAKQKYQGMMRARGANVDKNKDERIRLAKARSFCSVCKKKGHWHRDPECPANQGKKPVTQEAHVVYFTGAASSDKLWAITDCACSRTLAGPDWVQSYVRLAKKHGWPYFQIEQKETFKFGGKTLFPSNRALVCWLNIAGKWFCVKIARVAADVPLLLSRPSLAALGMEFQMATNRANFKNLGIESLQLDLSTCGHPRVEISDPGTFPPSWPPEVDWSMSEIHVPCANGAYMCAADSLHTQEPRRQKSKTIFYPKNLEEIYVKAFTADTLAPETFMSWWKETSISRDFWIESENYVDRIHVTPRKFMFDPSKWNTTMVDLKNELLAVLDDTRTSTCIPCVDGKLILEVEHDWKIELGKHAGYLWIGRSRFKRRSAVPQFEKPQVFLTVNEPHSEPMENEEGGVGGRTPRSRSPIPKQVDCAGTTTFGGGSKGPPSEEEFGSVEPQPGSTHREMQGGGNSNSGKTDKGDTHVLAAEELPPQFGRGGDLRPLCGLQLQGSPEGLPGLVSEGSRQQPQPLHGIGKIGRMASETFGRWGNWIYGRSSQPGPGGEPSGSGAKRTSEAQAEGEGLPEAQGQHPDTAQEDQATGPDLHGERVQPHRGDTKDHRGGDPRPDREIEHPSGGAEGREEPSGSGGSSRSQMKKRAYWEHVQGCIEDKRTKQKTGAVQMGATSGTRSTPSWLFIIEYYQFIFCEYDRDFIRTCYDAGQGLCQGSLQRVWEHTEEGGRR